MNFLSGVCSLHPRAKAFYDESTDQGPCLRVHDQGDLSSERILAVVELGEMDAAKRDDQCQDHEKPQQH